MKRSAQVLGVLVLFSAVLAGVYDAGRAHAYGVPTPNTLSFTGSLYTFGAPDNGSHTFVVSLFVPPAMTAACSTTVTATTVNGQFSVPLSSTCVQIIHQNPNVNADVVVDTTDLGQTALTSVPYALEADTASNAAPLSQISTFAPSGLISAFGGGSPPTGWLLCNGQAVSRTTYASLFTAIGIANGGGDGSTTFNLPDLRGRFLRGVDGGAGRDPDTTTRTAPSPSGATSAGNAGDLVGSVQSGQVQAHSHAITDPGHVHGIQGQTWCSINQPGGSLCVLGSNGSVQNNEATQGAGTGISIQNSTGDETRPINAYVNFIIKT